MDTVTVWAACAGWATHLTFNQVLWFFHKFWLISGYYLVRSGGNCRHNGLLASVSVGFIGADWDTLGWKPMAC